MKLGASELVLSPEDLVQAVENYLNQVCFRETAAVSVESVDKNYEKWTVKVKPKPLGLRTGQPLERLMGIPMNMPLIPGASK